MNHTPLLLMLVMLTGEHLQSQGSRARADCWHGMAGEGKVRRYYGVKRTTNADGRIVCRKASRPLAMATSVRRVRPRCPLRKPSDPLETPMPYVAIKP